MQLRRLVRGRVFDDWLGMVEATLTLLPEHAVSVAATGLPAEDPPEVKALWKDLNSRYKPAQMQMFAGAFAELLNATWPSDVPVWDDLIGAIYMSWGWPSTGFGQYFTPWHIAEMMAQLTYDGGEEVHKMLRAAIAKEPLAEAMLMAGMAQVILRPEARAFDWLVDKVLPLCAQHIEPIKVIDPCCGSGIMLLAKAKQYPAWMVQMGLVQFYGMDIDATCVQMCKINMMLYGLNGYAGKLAAGALPLVEKWKALHPDGEPVDEREPAPAPQTVQAEASSTIAAEPVEPTRLVDVPPVEWKRPVRQTTAIVKPVDPKNVKQLNLFGE